MGEKGCDWLKVSVCFDEDAVMGKSESFLTRSFFVDKSTRLVAIQCLRTVDGKT